MSSWLQKLYHKFFQKGHADITETKCDGKIKAFNEKFTLIENGFGIIDENDGGDEIPERLITGVHFENTRIDSSSRSLLSESREEEKENEIPQGEWIRPEKTVTTEGNTGGIQCNGNTSRKICRFVLVVPTWINSDVEHMSMEKQHDSKERSVFNKNTQPLSCISLHENLPKRRRVGHDVIASNKRIKSNKAEGERKMTSITS